jgi:nucleotide-binding universal stress UspA family protein
MSEEEGAQIQPYQRILVALDGSSASLAALDTAAQLAGDLHAELVGLFVEDANLLRLAGLPFAQEVRYLSASQQAMNRQRMEAELRAQAGRARRALMAAAQAAHVVATFRVVQGEVALEVLTAAMEADLLLLGRVSRPLSRRTRLGSTARLAAAQAPKSVLVIQPGDFRDHPVVVTFDGTAQGWQALETALHLARPAGRLRVLLLVDPAEGGRPMEARVAFWLQRRGMAAEYEWLERVDAAELGQLIRQCQGRLLVLGGDRWQLPAEAIQALLDTTDCSLMLIR